MRDGLRIFLTAGRGKTQLIAVRLRRAAIVGQFEREADRGIQMVDFELLVVAAVAIEIDRARLDLLIGQGVQRHPSPFDALDVALLLDMLRREPGVFGIGIVDRLHDDRRRGHDRDAISWRTGIAGFDVIIEILLQTSRALRQRAGIASAVCRHVHRDLLIDGLPVDRVEHQPHFTIGRQSAHGRRHIDPLAAKRFLGARLDRRDAHPGWRLNIGPGQNHAADGEQRIFGGKDLVERGHGQQRHQHIAQPNEPRSIDRGLDRHLGQPGGGLLFERVIHRLGQRRALGLEQQEVDQPVFQRGGAALDGVGGIDRIDAPHAQRQDLDDGIISAADHQQPPQEEAAPKAKSARQQPMIDQRGDQEKRQRAGAEGHQSAGDVDAAHLVARLAKLLVDVVIVIDGARIGSGGRLRRGSRSFGH